MAQHQARQSPGHRVLRRWHLFGLLLVSGCRPAPITIRTGLLLDGQGGQRRDFVIAVQAGRIVEVTPWQGGRATYDLSRFTVLPGLIDGHVHIASYFNRFGRPSDDSVTPAERAELLAANALATLRAGFTTVASLGAGADRSLRERIAAGAIPGPRILTSTGQIWGKSERADSLRHLVQEMARRGADLIKVIVPNASPDRGTASLSPAQLAALCGEATRLGLPSVVHAQDDASVTLAANAGCNRVEHGFAATDQALRMLADSNISFTPQCGLVLRNYLEHRANYEGMPGFDSTDFEELRDVLPTLPVLLGRALATPRLRVLFGSDATAGAHGRNAEDLVCRVREAGDTPMNALVSATSRNASALGLGREIGAVAPGYAADLIAVEGDPLKEIEAVLRVRFVMKAGTVFIRP